MANKIDDEMISVYGVSKKGTRSSRKSTTEYKKNNPNAPTAKSSLLNLVTKYADNESKTRIKDNIISANSINSSGISCCSVSSSDMLTGWTSPAKTNSIRTGSFILHIGSPFVRQEDEDFR